MPRRTITRHGWAALIAILLVAAAVLVSILWPAPPTVLCDDVAAQDRPGCTLPATTSNPD